MKDIFEGGATRNPTPHRFDLLDWEFIRGMAAIMKAGAEDHGERNWEQGMPEGVILDHLMGHLVEYTRERKMEDIVKVAVNAMMIGYFRRIEREEPEEEKIPY